MPTNQNGYNSRITDEALEKRFRDTFTSQGGAELVNDLYASGVIVPVVDFTAAAEGSGLRQDLQRAWDFSTGHVQTTNSTDNVITTTGFWLIQTAITHLYTSGGASLISRIQISDGLGSKTIFQTETPASIVANNDGEIITNEFVVFLRSGDSLQQFTNNTAILIDTSYRQIADVYGNLTNPLGYTSS